MHRTTNGGQSWEEASPDLTTNDKSRQTISGGLTPDNIGVEFCCVIYAIDESPVTEGVIWAGTNDGMIHLTRDGGANWTDVTANVPDMPVDGVVRNIDASKWEAGKAYMTVEAHQVGNFEPYVYRTEDFGDVVDQDRERGGGQPAQLHPQRAGRPGAARAPLPRDRELPVRELRRRGQLAAAHRRVATEPDVLDHRAGTLR